MTKPAAIALDLGSTSIKAAVLASDGLLGSIVSLPAPRITADNSRYESDALAYAAVAEQALQACLNDTGLSNTGSSTALGLSCQRSSFLVWQRDTGLPLTPLISWQDNRGQASCDELAAQKKSIRDLTGLPLTPYYFAPKLRRVLEDNPSWLARLIEGELLVGTLDTFLIWRWSGHFITDASMAARTLLMDVRTQQWSPQLCELFGIPASILAQIRPSAGMGLGLTNGLTLQASVGDQSAALIASIGHDSREALVNLGTGGFVIRHVPAEHRTPDGYLRTLVYQERDGQPHLAIEGTLNSIAAALAPYPANACRIEDMATQDIYALAEPSGLGAPYFTSNRFAACQPDPQHRDLGVQFSVPVAHLTQQQIAALLLEAIVFRVARILEDFQHDSAIERVYLSGGWSALACLQQGIAQCVPYASVSRLTQSEASLQGAALLATGMQPATRREAELIGVARDNTALAEKYRRWKDWLDALLEADSDK